MRVCAYVYIGCNNTTRGRRRDDVKPPKRRAPTHNDVLSLQYSIQHQFVCNKKKKKTRDADNNASLNGTRIPAARSLNFPLRITRGRRSIITTPTRNAENVSKIALRAHRRGSRARSFGHLNGRVRTYFVIVLTRTMRFDRIAILYRVYTPPR